MSRTPIEHAVLDWNELGTPVSSAFDDVYFSNTNGLAETNYVFLQQNGLPERWLTHPERRFVIAETGFGTGLNFLALWKAFQVFRQAHPESTVKELHFISFEKFPVTHSDLIKAHQAWPDVAEQAQKLHQHYPPAVADCHRMIFDQGSITLDLWFGDIKDCMPQVWCGDNGLVDAWFLDGFAPSKNPEMWSQERFEGMVKLAKSGCTVATFTAAGFVRRGLNDAGFEMRKVKGFGHKREMLTGVFPLRQEKDNTAPYFHREDAHQHDNIAIIGGGIASATTALALLQRGQTVTLYCKDSLVGQGASGNRQGAVYPLLKDANEILSRFFAPAFVFARQYVEQATQLGEFDHDWCGVTQLAYDEKSQKKLEKMLSGGFPIELMTSLSEEETRQQLGLNTHCHGISYPMGGWLCPQQLTQVLIAHAQTFPTFTLKLDTEITQLESNTKNHWLLQDQHQHAYQHDTVIVANGHRYAQFTQTQNIPATAVRGQVSHIPTNTTLRKLKTVLCYDGYLTPANTKTETHCIGASYDRRNANLTYEQADQESNKQRLIDCLPKAPWAKDIDISDHQARVGVRCASRDHLPFIGNVCELESVRQQYTDLHKNPNKADRIDSLPNLFTLMGLGSRGLCSAPLAGELLASQICGDPLPLPLSVLEALHPARLWVRKLRKGKAIKETI